MSKHGFRDSLMSIQSKMLSFAYMLTSNKDDAYDLLQDTTLKVLDNESKYAENINFRGWVFTIMRNIFINNYRRRVRSAMIVDSTEDLARLNIAQNSVEESPEGAYGANEITEAINSFSEDFRIPFSMHIAGYKYSEIAEKMQLPLGTVKSRIYVARKRLQQMFVDYQ